MPDNDELLEPKEAADYLAQKWGIPSYSVDALKMLRKRWGITPAYQGKKTTLYRKSDLDKIPKPGGKRRQRDEQDTQTDLVLAV